MKKIALSSAVAIGLSLAASSGAFAANDGTITVKGTIESMTCTVEGQPPGGGTVNKEVDLLGVSAGLLTEPNSTGGDKGFLIKVGSDGESNCTNGKTAYVRFDPASPNIDPSTGRLKNAFAGPDAATNVQIQFLNGGAVNSPINIYTEQSAGVLIENNQALIPLIARLYSLGNATAGQVESSVGFMVVYN